MSEAVRILRQSQGTEDSKSIQQQRDSTRELAEDLGIDMDENLRTIDLADTTGFSVFYKSEADDRIDTQPEIQQLLDDLRAGRYEYLLAHDDTRLARDSFFYVVEYAAKVGDCNIEFATEPPEDRLTFVVSRAATAESKKKEIERSQQAVKTRLENGYHHGEPPFGLKFDENGQYLVKDPDEWSVIERVFELRDEGLSYRAIAERVRLSKSGISQVLNDDRRQQYLSRMNPENPAVSD